MNNDNPVQIKENARNVAFAYINGTNELAPIPMNSDGSIRIEIHPQSVGTAVANKINYDENCRWTSFGVSSSDSLVKVPITMNNIGGTTPCVRVDLLEL